MKSSLSGERVKLHVDSVKPYWRNPRKITDEAVEAVRQSIHEFGYLQPIVVDKDDTIIIGHTRYSAMRRMGVDLVEVLRVDLDPARAKQLRVIDNRTHEYSVWDRGGLINELDGMGNDLIQLLFPEARPVEDPGTDWVEGDVEIDGPQVAELICPMCFHEWERETTREEILTGKLVADPADYKKEED